MPPTPMRARRHSPRRIARRARAPPAAARRARGRPRARRHGSTAATPARTAKSASLAGVTITFGDQLKEYQTIFAATNALKGAAYTVNWTNFIGGPPVIAAETGGSVDLGDMAETPTDLRPVRR